MHGILLLDKYNIHDRCVEMSSGHDLARTESYGKKVFCKGLTSVGNVELYSFRTVCFSESCQNLCITKVACTLSGKSVDDT